MKRAVALILLAALSGCDVEPPPRPPLAEAMPVVPREDADASKVQAPQYREVRDEIVALRKRLRAARAKGWLRDGGTLESLPKWGEFARKFREDHDRIEGDLNGMPLAERMRFVDTLDYVQQMFLATATENPRDYGRADADYGQSLRDLDGHLEGLGPAAVTPGPDAPTLLRMAKDLEARNESAALRYYGDVVARFPGSPEAKEATARVGQLKAKGR